jgi:hypothetical protein
MFYSKSFFERRRKDSGIAEKMAAADTKKFARHNAATLAMDANVNYTPIKLNCQNWPLLLACRSNIGTDPGFD